MVRHAWFFALLVLATSLTASAAESMSADQQAISKIEKEWMEAVKSQDKAFYEKYVSDDFTYISEDGVFTSGRDAYIDLAMKWPAYVQTTGSDERIMVRGTTGVATGRATVKDSTGAIASTLYTDVFAKGPDGWKVVASQETKTKTDDKAALKAAPPSTPGQPAGKRIY